MSEQHVSSSARAVADWLSFGKGNAKLGEEIATFSIPAGWTCPGASQCLARANRETGVIADGSNQAFDALLPVRKQHFRACANRDGRTLRS